MLANQTSRLNLGCGNKKMAGFLNVDCIAATNPDLCLNLNATPWDLPSSHFTEVHCYDVLEHLDNIISTMEELHRITKPGAKIYVTVPHFSSRNAFLDPTHKRFFSVDSFRYFQESDDLAYYSSARFRVIKKQIIFNPSLAGRVIRPLANRFSKYYEEQWAWIFPAWFLNFELERP